MPGAASLARAHPDTVELRRHGARPLAREYEGDACLLACAPNQGGTTEVLPSLGLEDLVACPAGCDGCACQGGTIMALQERYDFREAEARLQQRWADLGIYPVRSGDQRARSIAWIRRRPRYPVRFISATSIPIPRPISWSAITACVATGLLSLRL